MWFQEVLRDAANPLCTALQISLRKDEGVGKWIGTNVRYADCYGLCFIIRGRGVHMLDGLEHHVMHGDVYVVSPGMSHLWLDEAELTIATLWFSPQAFTERERAVLIQEDGIRAIFIDEPYLRRTRAESVRWLHLSPEAQSTRDVLIDAIESELQSRRPSSEVMARALFLQLIVWLGRSYMLTTSGRGQEGGHGSRDRRVSAALRYLEENFTEEVSISGLAASVFLSSDHFTEIFEQAVGMPPREYVRHLRVQRAKQLMQTTDLLMTDIAQMAGFRTSSYFARSFRAATGMSPRDFKVARRSRV